MQRRFWIGVAVAMVVGLGAMRSSSLCGAEEGAWRLRFKSGDFASGRLVASDQANRMAWQSPYFREPFLVDVHAIQSIDAPALAKPVISEGEFAFECTNGDKFWGDLVAWDAAKLVVDTKSLGRLEVDPKWIRSVRRWGAESQVLYQGPMTVQEWQSLDANMPWQMESGSLISRHKSSKVRGNVRLPAKAQIDLRLSWGSRPGFIITLGADDKQTATTSEFSLEVWDDKLALVRDFGSKSDAVHLLPLEPKNGYVELTIYLDQEAGKAIVYNDRGRLLGSITLPMETPKVGGYCLIENYERELRLDLFRVQAWNNRLPVEVLSGSGVIVKTDQTQVTGKPVGLDEGRVLRIESEGETASVPLAEVSEMLVQPPVANHEPDALTLTLQDQSRITGSWISSDEKIASVALQVGGVPIAVPLASITAVRGTVGEYPTTKPDGIREGQLLLQDTLLFGYLIDSPAMEDATSLHWKGRQIENGVHLLASAHGRIDFRRIEQRANLARQGNAGGQGPARQNVPNSANVVRRTVPNISLRTGDLILAELHKIDDQGVTFKSSSSSTTFVPHEQVQMIELRRIRRERVQAAQKMARLLTIPRQRKNDPPKHLVASIDGDYLRGHIVKLDEESMVIEVNLEQVTIPTENLAHIVWLHDRGWDDGKGVAGKDGEKEVGKGNLSGKPGAFQVHAVERVGWKMTFMPERIENEILIGTSPLLGSCNVPIKNLDLLLLGDDVTEQARELQANPWKLALAKQPRVAEEDEGGEGGTGGTESTLVGKAAPKVDGETLDGSRFRLEEAKGQIVVLDFWASWCGPCMQTMPVVEEVVSEFAAEQVMLVGVNLEEPAERAQAAMDRLKLKMKVVLDVDGAAARRYEANAIPQTVIIDRQGVVRNIFVGGGGKFAEQLRGALQKVIAGEGS